MGNVLWEYGGVLSMASWGSWHKDLESWATAVTRDALCFFLSISSFFPCVLVSWSSAMGEARPYPFHQLSGEEKSMTLLLSFSQLLEKEILTGPAWVRWLSWPNWLWPEIRNTLLKMGAQGASVSWEHAQKSSLREWSLREARQRERNLTAIRF